MIQIINRLNLEQKIGLKLMMNHEEYATDALKTASKTAIQKTAETTGDSIEYKIADKITLQKIIMQKKMKEKYWEKDIYFQQKVKKIIDDLGLI